MTFWERLNTFYLFLRSMKRANRGMIKTMWKLSALPQPAITFFGGSKLEIDDPDAKKIVQLARRLAKNGFSIITGGGPGIMEAANMGAFQATHKRTPKNGHSHEGEPLRSFGINVASLQENNKYTQDEITVDQFFTRKWLMVRYAAGFVVGPGGFGTLDELTEVLTLIQTRHLPKTPIVLIGVEYWKPFIDWIESSGRNHNLVSESDIKLLFLTDSVDEAYQLITTTCTDDACAIMASIRSKK